MSLLPIPRPAFPDPLGEAELPPAWEEAWKLLGHAAPPGLRETLEHAHAEPHRHYHDPRHLRECLALWARWRDQCQHPGEVALALWFHDAVYEPRRSDNEARSAAWAVRSLARAGLAREALQRVHDLIMATRHDAPAAGGDALLLVDIDLAILGSPPARFDSYERDVRKEYGWVPGFRYRRKRAAVLKGFLGRVPLYRCAPAVELLEAQARINLSAALGRLAR
jgi:predicted metal-dependent HD superfamily phosphohydrolase